MSTLIVSRRADVVRSSGLTAQLYTGLLPQRRARCDRVDCADSINRWSNLGLCEAPRRSQTAWTASVGGGVFAVPYTYKSLAFLWLTIFGLVALTASGTLAHSWPPVLLLAALTAPRLILRIRIQLG